MRERVTPRIVKNRTPRASTLPPPVRGHSSNGNARARFALDWDLNSDEGQRVRGGIYFLRFTLGGATHTRRLLVLR